MEQSKHRNRWIECSLCSSCYKQSRPRPRNGSKGAKSDSSKDEASALLIGSVTSREVDGLALNSSEHGQVKLDHFIFDSADGWKRSESMCHPTLQLEISVDRTDYDKVGRACPNVTPSIITVVSDTGAQSCLWGLNEFLRCGFRRSDLIPVKRVMLAANR